jgi:hypothetical protein
MEGQGMVTSCSRKQAHMLASVAMLAVLGSCPLQIECLAEGLGASSAEIVNKTGLPVGKGCGSAVGAGVVGFTTSDASPKGAGQSMCLM